MSIIRLKNFKGILGAAKFTTETILEYGLLYALA